MREILFRGKRKDNGEWIEGFPVRIYDYGGLVWKMHPFNTNFDISHSVIPSTISEFTGLTDKNGKKIFEGDIIDASNEWWDAVGYAGHDSPIILVQWNDRECGFAPFSTYDSDCGVDIRASKCEVIGNIYDNPEIEWCE